MNSGSALAAIWALAAFTAVIAFVWRDRHRISKRIWLPLALSGASVGLIAVLVGYGIADVFLVVGASSTMISVGSLGHPIDLLPKALITFSTSEEEVEHELRRAKAQRNIVWLSILAFLGIVGWGIAQIWTS